jgi:hypothetical protein
LFSGAGGVIFFGSCAVLIGNLSVLNRIICMQAVALN